MVKETMNEQTAQDAKRPIVKLLVMRGSEIKHNHWHDAGAFGRCSYCGRYSDNRDCLIDDFKCDCGKENGYSGSFKKPTQAAIWSA